MRVRAAAFAVAVVVSAALTIAGVATAKADGGGVAKVVRAIDRIESRPIYRNSSWDTRSSNKGAAGCSPPRARARCSIPARR